MYQTLTSAKGQGGVTKWAFSLGAGPFLKGKAKKHPESGLAEGLLRLEWKDVQGIGVRVALALLKPGWADSASCLP